MCTDYRYPCVGYSKRKSACIPMAAFHTNTSTLQVQFFTCFCAGLVSRQPVRVSIRYQNNVRHIGLPIYTLVKI